MYDVCIFFRALLGKITTVKYAIFSAVIGNS